MPEGSIIAALKVGFHEPQAYYDALHSYGGSRSSFFDKYLNGHIVVGYNACQELYRNRTDIGRGRLSFSNEFFADCNDRQAPAGYHLLQSMSFFQDADSSYAVRRQ